MNGSLAQQLAAANGGPGVTLDELASRTGLPVAAVQAELAHGVFDDRTVTCEVTPYVKGSTPEPGRFRLGDPAPLIELK